MQRVYRLVNVAILLGVLLEAACTPVQPPTPTDGLPPGFDLQGHRVPWLTPGKHAASLRDRADLGVTTLELDLHLTADGEVVIWHDDAVTPDKCALSNT